MHKMAFAHVFGPEKKNGFGPFSYKFFVCIRVGLMYYFPKQAVSKFEMHLLGNSSRSYIGNTSKHYVTFTNVMSCH